MPLDSITALINRWDGLTVTRENFQIQHPISKSNPPGNETPPELSEQVLEDLANLYHHLLVRGRSQWLIVTR